MVSRILASFAFLAGGVLMWFVLVGLRAVAHSEAGMSAGPVSGTPFSDAMIPWFVCSYFAISAIGIAFFKRKSQLMTVAVIAHAMILIVFCLFCREGLSEGLSQFIGGLFSFIIATVLVFSPWLIIWGVLLSTAKDD